MSQTHSKMSAKEKYTLWEFLKDFFFNFRTFAKEKLSAQKTQYLLLVLYCFGVSLGLERSEILANFFPTSAFDNWNSLWLTVLLSAPLLGMSTFYIIGSIYHAGVVLADGKKDAVISRQIYLYSNIPIILFNILSYAFFTFTYEYQYFAGGSNFWINMVFPFLFIAILLYSIYLRYQAMRIIQKTKRIRSLLFFVFLPVLIYVGVTFFWLKIHENNVGKILSYSEQANQELSAGNYAQAEELMDQALLHTPKNDFQQTAKIYANKAYLYELQGLNKEALRYYEESQKLLPNDSLDYYLNEASISMLQEDYEQAISAFRHVLSIEPGNFFAINNLGELILFSDHSDNCDEAFEYNEKAFLAYTTANTSYNLGMNHFCFMEYEKALSLLEKANDLDPGNTVIIYSLAVVNHGMGNFEDAKLLFEKAIELDPAADNEETESYLLDIKNKFR